MSYAESILYDALRLVLHPNERIDRNVRPDILKNPVTGRNLELDFYLPRLSLGIEVQGPHHYSDSEQQERDQTKRRLAIQAGIHLWELGLFQAQFVPLRDRFLAFRRDKNLHIPLQAWTENCLIHDARARAYKTAILTRFGPSDEHLAPQPHHVLQERRAQNEQLKRALFVLIAGRKGTPAWRAKPLDFGDLKKKIRVQIIGTAATRVVSRRAIISIH